METGPRLEPIEKPKGLTNRLSYWLSRRQFGKVPSVIRVVYAREAGPDGRVSDATFERLRVHFDERELVDVVALVAVERFFNGITLPLRLGSDGLCALRLGRKQVEATA